jgi:hypothetical protein
MNDSTENGGGGSGAGRAGTHLRGHRPLARLMGWQTVSSSCAWSANVGPAGRRRVALFSGGLARSLNQWGSTDRKWVADGSSAASRNNRVSWVALASAAWGSVGDGEIFEGADERASQRRCLVLGNEGTGDAGVGLAARSRWRSRQTGPPGGSGTGW